MRRESYSSQANRPGAAAPRRQLAKRASPARNRPTTSSDSLLVSKRSSFLRHRNQWISVASAAIKPRSARFGVLQGGDGTWGLPLERARPFPKIKKCYNYNLLRPFQLIRSPTESITGPDSLCAEPPTRRTGHPEQHRKRQQNRTSPGRTDLREHHLPPPLQNTLLFARTGYKWTRAHRETQDG